MSDSHLSSASRAVLFFFRRHRGVYLTLTCVLVVSAILEVLSAAALFPLMSAILQVEPTAGRGRILAALSAVVRLLPGHDPVLAAVGLFAGLITLKACAALAREYLIAVGGARAVCATKHDIFTRYASAPYAFFVGQRQADLSYALTSAPQSLEALLILLPSLVAQGLVIVALGVLLATADWQLTIAIIVVGVGLYRLLRRIAQRVSYKAGHQRATFLAKELGLVTEFLSGIKEIIPAGSAKHWTDQHDRESQNIRRVNTRDYTWRSIPGVLIEFAFFLMLCAGVGAYQYVHAGSVAPAMPLLTVYAYALYRLIGAVTIFSNYKLRLSGTLPDVERLYRTLHEPYPHVREGTASLSHFTDSLRFEKVCFTYPGRLERALREVSLNIKKGGVTALVGHSGAGKTTLVNLLLRLYDPDEGAILVDGLDLRDHRRDSWWRLVGYVSQEAFILNGTVADNIRFGLPGCTAAQVEAAARAAYAHDFICALPQGYATVVGDRGMALSGGQRQRLAIARALLRKPEVLIFDEAMSALDGVSEGLIQRAIAELMKDHTMILVAHRLSTVRFADQIVVLEHGRVVEVGSHEDLTARKGHYSLLMTAASSGTAT